MSELQGLGHVGPPVTGKIPDSFRKATSRSEQRVTSLCLLCWEVTSGTGAEVGGHRSRVRANSKAVVGSVVMILRCQTQFKTVPTGLANRSDMVGEGREETSTVEVSGLSN